MCLPQLDQTICLYITVTLELRSRDSKVRQMVWSCCGKHMSKEILFTKNKHSTCVLLTMNQNTILF